MGKGMDKKKETKKAAKLTTKEKKARKDEKKSNKAQLFIGGLGPRPILAVFYRYLFQNETWVSFWNRYLLWAWDRKNDAVLSSRLRLGVAN